MERFGQSGRVCEESEYLGFAKNSGAAKQLEAGIETQLHAVGMRMPDSLVEMPCYS